MILVFGSLNGDFFLNVQKFPAPGETILTPDYVVKPGGKGANQAAAAAKAGGEVVFFGSAGQDEVAKIPLSALKAAGVDCSYMQVSSLATGMAMIMVDSSGENSIVVASGANGTLCAEGVPDGMLQAGRTLVMQMEVPAAENFKLLRRAKAKGVKTVLNNAPARPLPAEVLPLIDYLIVNEIEAGMICDGLLEGESLKNDKETALFLAEKTGGVCLITLGGKGVIAAQGNKIFQASVLNIRPIDTTGAGDAFAGIFSAMIDRGFSLKEAVQYASAGAGLACLKTGAQEALPVQAEIEQRVGEIKIT